MEVEIHKVFNWCVKNHLYDDSLVCLHRLRQLRPEQSEYLEDELIVVLKLLFKSHEQSQENLKLCFEKVIHLFPRCPHVYFEAGCFLYKSGVLLAAISQFEKTLELKSNHTAAKVCLENVKSQAVDQWHFRMLNDNVRNKCFQKAIAYELRGTHLHSVLDIGTGTGILAIFAHQAGASRIYACESSDSMFGISERVLSANNLRKEILLFNKYSYKLNVPLDIPERVSLLITELFDAGLFGEGLLNTLKHAWDHLMLPHADNANEQSKLYGKVIPNSATIYVSLVECKWLRKSYRLVVNNFGHLDFSNLTVKLEESEPYDSEYLRHLPGGYKMLSEPITLCKVNFNNCSEIETLIQGCMFEKELLCTANGILDCVVVWFKLHLNDSVSLSTAPEIDSCWEQAIFPVPKSLKVYVKECVNLNMQIEGHLKLERIVVKGQEYCNKANISLSRDWIRKLNCSDLANCLESALQSAYNENKRRVVDMSTVPLTALLALKMKAEKVLVIGKNKADKLLELCNLLNVPTDNLCFLNIEEISNNKIENKYNVLFFDPIELSGNFVTNVFEDLTHVAVKVLTTDCLIFPQSIQLHGLCLDSPVFSKYKKVKPNELLDDLKICDVMNTFQTQFHQDIHYNSTLGSSLTVPQKFCQLKSSSFFSPDLLKSTVAIVKSGTFNLFVFWIAMQYNETNTLVTKSSDSVYNLAGVSPLSELYLDVNDKLEIGFTLCNSYPMFEFQKTRIK